MLNECLTEHELCSKRRKSPLLKRVLRISSLSRLRLIEPSQELEAQYVTLNHCWGQIQPLKTTKATLAAMFVLIPDNLLIVFTQAIMVANSLGINYI